MSKYKHHHHHQQQQQTPNPSKFAEGEIVISFYSVFYAFKTVKYQVFTAGSSDDVALCWSEERSMVGQKAWPGILTPRLGRIGPLPSAF